jgi:hypothetical protein
MVGGSKNLVIQSLWVYILRKQLVRISMDKAAKFKLVCFNHCRLTSSRREVS